MKEERRIFERVPVSVEVRAEYRDSLVIKARSLDISHGGMCLLSSIELPKGKVIELEMDLPIPLAIARGQVVWTRKVETAEGKYFQAGIDFTRLN